jgi:predicted DNA-binding antitoxin AbrB/MazE fold protein
MSLEVEAIYRNGVLELQSTVPLREGQSVRIVIQAEPGASQDERVSAMHTALDAWLDQQSKAVFLDPPDYPADEWARLNAELDALRTHIRRRSSEYTEAEIAADVETALAAMRKEAL